MRSGLKLIACGVTLAMMSTIGASAALADTPPGAEAISATVADVAPAVETTAFSTDGGELVATDGEQQVTAPATAAGSISVSYGEVSLDIGLPGADEPAEVSKDGTVTYDGDEFATAVQATSDGARVQVVIDDRDAPGQYSFAIPANASVMDLGDGSIAILQGEGDDETASLIEAPWAFDSDGVAVPTHFEVGDGELIQVVDHASASYSYPVVADPTVIVGTNWLFGGPYAAVRLSANETVRVAQGASAVSFVGMLVARIPNPYAVTAGTIVQLLGGAFAAHASAARAINKCAEYRYYWQARKAYPLFYSGGICG